MKKRLNHDSVAPFTQPGAFMYLLLSAGFDAVRHLQDGPG